MNSIATMFCYVVEKPASLRKRVRGPAGNRLSNLLTPLKHVVISFSCFSTKPS